ncbi:HNH endonuclease [Pantoea ananatis]|uniref:HNH endonuclease n=1 Tax=Pantoea ananas TaxID=553 RepID=UPI0002EFCEAB|nr:HNH endonuclease signature motif containing protein [Pantoea ananatis]
MIKNLVKFTTAHKKFIATFDGKSTHWDGTTQIQTSLRGAIRRHYLKEQKYHCAYCNRLRQDKHGYNWDIDHIIPKSTHAHFTYEPNNFAVTCKECNKYKDNYNVLVRGANASVIYPRERGDYLLVHPHFDEYYVHLEVKYTADLKVYHVPRSPKGAFTFSLCGLSRFTEHIAKTSEYVREEEVTIGFFDETFTKYYEGFIRYASLYSSSPEVRSMLFSQFLADETGVKPDEVAASIRNGHFKKIMSSNSLQAPLNSPLLPPPVPDND